MGVIKGDTRSLDNGSCNKDPFFFIGLPWAKFRLQGFWAS